MVCKRVAKTDHRWEKGKQYVVGVGQEPCDPWKRCKKQVIGWIGPRNMYYMRDGQKQVLGGKGQEMSDMWEGEEEGKKQVICGKGARKK